MARKYSMGYFADGNGAMEGVEYSADFARLQETLEEQAGSLAGLQEAVDEHANTFTEYMEGMCDRLNNEEETLVGLLQENQTIMKELCRQLDVLTELLGEFSAKFGEE